MAENGRQYEFSDQIEYYEDGAIAEKSVYPTKEEVVSKIKDETNECVLLNDVETLYLVRQGRWNWRAVARPTPKSIEFWYVGGMW